MKIQVTCNNCDKTAELSSINVGQEAKISSIMDSFRIDEIEIVEDFEQAKLNGIQFNCTTCSNFIVLTEFNS